MLLSSATINSLCHKGQPSNRRQRYCHPDTTVATTTAKTTVATTNRHVAAPMTLAFTSQAARQLCSTILLDSSTLAGFCYCAHILCDNQPTLSLRQLSSAATNGLCLHDSHTPNHNGQANLLFQYGQWSKPASSRNRFAFQAPNDPADRPMRRLSMRRHNELLDQPIPLQQQQQNKTKKNDHLDHMPHAAFICT